jgi:site-specific recombinase XerD
MLRLRRLSYQSAYAIVRRLSEELELKPRISNHSFRATGITTYLTNGGTLERAQRLANHSSMRTTQLYDRREDAIDVEEVEKLRF